jgi:hypothetical protein
LPHRHDGSSPASLIPGRSGRREKPTHRKPGFLREARRTYKNLFEAVKLVRKALLAFLEIKRAAEWSDICLAAMLSDRG